MERLREGKLTSPSIQETDAGGDYSSRLHVHDTTSGLTFLIDTGAEISLLPAKIFNKRIPTSFKLVAANNSQIDTFGSLRQTLHIGLRPLTWNFCIATVPYPIIGADLLKSYGLLVDLANGRLVDPKFNAFTNGSVKNIVHVSVNPVDPTSVFARILVEFSEITRDDEPHIATQNDVRHHIVTHGLPVHENARRLAPEKLKAAKAEFKQLVDLGICRPSSSQWASPIHLVKKKDNTFRVCGDFRRLNTITQPDRFPLPHLHDCSANLRGKKIFSKLDLYKAYHQLAVAEEDVSKTAVITPFGLFEYLFMTFGLRNASQTFQRYLFNALGNLEFVFCYVDDILVFSTSIEEHTKHLRIVFERLKKFHLRLNLSKCEFDKTKLEFLGYDGRLRGFANRFRQKSKLLKIFQSHS